MERIKVAMVSLAESNRPLTVRQLFYPLVSAGVIDKTEAEYKRTVVRLTLELRRAGEIPWDWVVDRTRWFFKPQTFDSLSDALEESVRVYRRSLWTDADEGVQVWCESMSVAGIIRPETNQWDVPLYPGKGYSSHDFLRSAAHDIADAGKDTVVYLLGDYDPSGRDIIRFVCGALREYADEVDPGVLIDFQTIAVTETQIAEWRLPGHPAKTTESRHARYGIDHAVELEAIPPERLRGIVPDAITSHIDLDALGRLREVEDAERDTLRRIAVEGGAR
jgi:hypothetical protein